MTWFFWAFVAAIAAAATTILAKIGVSGVPSTTATAVRTVVILLMSWGIVFAMGEHKGARTPARAFVALPRLVRPGDGRILARLLPCPADGAGIGRLSD